MTEQTRGHARGSVSRRDFLRVGGLGVVGLSVAEQAALARARNGVDRKSCLFILLTGGPSQFETFDPKPDAPAEIRGPLKAVSTSVPGIALSESLPALAQRANRFALVRSLWHDAAPIHETGMQLLQTGFLARGGQRFPHFGAALHRLRGARGRIPASVVLAGPLQETGVNADRGQTAGLLGPAYGPVFATTEDDRIESATAGETELVEPLPDLSQTDEPAALRRAYGENRFGRLLLQARRLVECGVRCVTVNLFDRLAGQITWDCHGRGPWSPATLYDYRDELCPRFDRALATLLDDLDDRGLLDETLVVAVGEFGRSPRVNDRGGREHWPAVWSGLLAGGGVRGGQVVGASDRYGAEPAERPVAAPELTATIHHALGVPQSETLHAGDGTLHSVADHEPIRELFG